MTPMSSRLSSRLLVILGAVLLLVLLGYSIYSYSHVRTENTALTQQVAAMQSERIRLLEELATASSTIDEFTTQLGDITHTVGTLKKLTETDPELLEKYSKVFFLNENYVPRGLISIDSHYTYNGKDLQFLSAAYPFLTALLDAASAEGLHLTVESSYRSFSTQSGLKSSYKITYGAGTANSFSADQGYSEHQLGTTVDFTTASLKGGLSGFDKTPEFAWLTAHAYEFGFILSYPAGNGYYVYEPWHWRFVGTALAKRLHEEHEHFYDLEQRQLDPYLVKIFDPLQ